MRFWPRRRDPGTPLDYRLTWEAGVRLRDDWEPRRVAVVAHWSADGSWSRSVQALTATLIESGFEVVLASSAEFAGDGRAAQDLPPEVCVMRRPNSGYDFGTWASVLHNLPAIRRAQEIILANDSMVGPFDSLTPTIQRMMRTPCAAWSLTESTQFHWHPQSYFVGYRNAVLDRPDVRSFWSGIRVHTDKTHVIRNYELGQGRVLHSGAYSTAVAFPAAVLGTTDGRNPTIKAWRTLLDAGLPMVKRQLVTEPEVADDSAEIPDEVQRRFGVNIKEWL